MAGIIYSDYYIPETCYDAMEILKCSSREEVGDEEFCESFISQSGQKRICVERELSEIQMFEKLLDGFFEAKGIEPEAISHILYITFPEELVAGEINTPYVLQIKYSLTASTVVTIYQDCATILQALQFANAMIESKTASNVMILSVCKLKKPQDRFIGTAIVGDGAGIFVVGDKDYESEIVNIKSIANGKYSYNMYNNIEEKIWDMDILKRGADLIINTLDENKMEVALIDPIIMQNLNYSAYYVYSKFIKVPIKKLYMRNLAHGGHLASTDTIRNYTDAIREERVQKDGFFLLYAAGMVGKGNDSTLNVALLRRT